LKLNGMYLLFVYADDVNSGWMHTYLKKKNTEAWLVGRKKTGLEVHDIKTKYMVTS